MMAMLAAVYELCVQINDSITAGLCVGLTSPRGGAVTERRKVEGLADAELRHVLVFLLRVHRRALRDELRERPSVVGDITADLDSQHFHCRRHAVYSPANENVTSAGVPQEGYT